ncbi:hypothetical protein EV426DRAFT_609943 [Tirmania nivea]|nr:hypothetical protein EV426DRAFT_609943 [Tirmania nivea]
MVFKPFANLARQGITKHLVNGNYAQQVIAASQSLPIIKAQVNTHRHPSSGRPTATGSRALSPHAPQSNDSNNTFYPTHGQQLDDTLDKDARRYLFSKKILWSKAQHQTQGLQAAAENVDAAELPVPSPVESLAEAGEVEAVSNVDTETRATVDIEGRSSGAEAVEALSPVDRFNAELEKLKRQGRFKDITIQFQFMVQSGLEPNTETFNCLLSAKAQLMRLGVLDNRISYLLDVYKDLLHRKLVPSTKTYSILLTSLVKCARSADATRELKAKEVGRFGFVAPSQHALLAGEVGEGDGIAVALELFDASTYVVKDRVYGVDVYTTLIEACARRGLTEEMFKILRQMEASGVRPNRDIYFNFIDAFAKDKDLHSVLEMYEEVKNSVTESEKDTLYKHLVMAYVTVGDTSGATSFLEKVIAQRGERPDVVVEGFVEGFLYKGEFSHALDWLDQFTANGSFHCYWTMSTLAKAADAGDFDTANQAYQNLLAIMRSMEAETQEVELNWIPKAEDLMDAKTAFLALCSRTHKLDLARQVWTELLGSKRTSHLDLGATVAYVKLLFDNGFSTEAVQTVANMLSGFESVPASKPGSWAVAAGWRNILDFLTARQLLTAEVAGEIWKIGGYTPEGPLPADCIKSLIAACSTVPLLEMTWVHLDILLQLHACYLLAEGRNATIEDLNRFEQIISVAMRTLPLDNFTRDTVSHAISLNASNMHPEFVQSWHEYLTMQSQPQLPIAYTQDGTLTSPTLVASEGSVEEQDPYWTRMDIRASSSIENMIDKKKGLNEVMKIFRNTKESGKVLNYQTIARLIGHATRMKNMDACNDVFATAKKEIPLLSEYSSVRSGWCYIYDSMIAACLNSGEHQRAATYRDEMAQIGGVPSANTYGLFIVNLKQSHETFDEASEAMKLFEQSKAQNVFPTPFLYNAVIGKLARARRVDDCLFYYAEMRAFGLKPTSVTYGTMINALCRVSDERYAEELFQEMESMPNYKPRAAPYNSMIQFFAITKRDRAKVLQYYERMLSVGIEPSGHTYKLLIDAYASLDPPDIDAAQGVLDMMEQKRVPVECTHHASLIHAKGCVLHDIEGCLAYFHKTLSNRTVKPDAILYQALFEALVANHRVHDTPKYLEDLKKTRVEMTPYIANTLIHGWALEKNIENAKLVYDMLNSNENSKLRREPSTYEAMTRAYLAVEDRASAMIVVNEMRSRGYPTAVMGRILDLVKGGQMYQTVVG